MIGFGSIKKLFGGLSKTREDLARRLTEAIGGGGVRLDAARLEAIEEALIAADVGVTNASRVVEGIQARARGRSELSDGELRTLMIEELASALQEVSPPSPGTASERVAAPPPPGTGSAGKTPRVVLVVGVTGVGKTTTVAKIAARERVKGQRLALLAADGFRVGAIEQLMCYAEILDAPESTVKSRMYYGLSGLRTALTRQGIHHP